MLPTRHGGGRGRAWGLRRTRVHSWDSEEKKNPRGEMGDITFSTELIDRRKKRQQKILDEPRIDAGAEPGLKSEGKNGAQKRVSSAKASGEVDVLEKKDRTRSKHAVDHSKREKERDLNTKTHSNTWGRRGETRKDFNRENTSGKTLLCCAPRIIKEKSRRVRLLGAGGGGGGGCHRRGVDSDFLK